MQAIRGNLILKRVNLKPFNTLGIRSDLSYHAGDVTSIGKLDNPGLSVGDRVVFQLPEFMMPNITVDNSSGEQEHVVKYADALMTIHSESLSSTDFSALGHWIIVKAVYGSGEDGPVYVPEKYRKINSFTVASIGCQVKTPVQRGDTLFFDKNKATRVGFDDSRDYYFVHDSNALAYARQ